MKQRHGCATVWLIFASLGAVIKLIQDFVTRSGALDGLLGMEGDVPEGADAEAIAMMERVESVVTPAHEAATTAFLILSLAAVVGLWAWRRWAYWGYLAVSVAMGVQAVVLLGKMGDVMGEAMDASGEMPPMPIGMGQLMGGMAWAGIIFSVGFFLIAFLIGSPSVYDQLEPMPDEGPAPPDKDWDAV